MLLYNNIINVLIISLHFSLGLFDSYLEQCLKITSEISLLR